MSCAQNSKAEFKLKAEILKRKEKENKTQWDIHDPADNHDPSTFLLNPWHDATKASKITSGTNGHKLDALKE